MGNALGVIAQEVSVRSQAWMFTRHFLEMCIPMCMVGTPIVALVFSQGPRTLGYGDPRDQFLYVSVIAISVIYTLPMLLWMRFRGMAARPTWEMSAATVGLGFAFVALAAIGLVSESGLRALASPTFCGPACVVMVVVMFTRLRYYTGRSGLAMHARMA